MERRLPQPFKVHVALPDCYPAGTWPLSSRGCCDQARQQRAAAAASVEISKSNCTVLSTFP